MTTATVSPATITISTTPLVAPGTSIGRRSVDRSPLVGLVARIVAGITGALLGLAIGLVSAGFDTTRMLLALGALAVGVGWFVAVANGRSPSTQDRRRCP